MGCGASKTKEDTPPTAGSVEKKPSADLPSTAVTAIGSAVPSKQTTNLEVPANDSSTQEAMPPAGDTATAPVTGTAGSAVPSKPQTASASPKPATTLGSVAVAPSPPRQVPESPRNMDPATFVANSPDGIYCTFASSDHGTLLAKYSHTEVEGALAFAKPSTFATIPEYKYKKPVSVHSRIQSGHSMYYQGWCQFIKEARSHNSEIVLLQALEEKETSEPEAFPKMKIFVLCGTKVSEIKGGLNGKPVNTKYIDIAAIVPDSYRGFDDAMKASAEMERTDFINKAKAPQDHYYIDFK